MLLLLQVVNMEEVLVPKSVKKLRVEAVLCFGSQELCPAQNTHNVPASLRKEMSSTGEKLRFASAEWRRNVSASLRFSNIPRGTRIVFNIMSANNIPIAWTGSHLYDSDGVSTAVPWKWPPPSTLFTPWLVCSQMFISGLRRLRLWPGNCSAERACVVSDLQPRISSEAYGTLVIEYHDFHRPCMFMSAEEEALHECALNHSGPREESKRSDFAAAPAADSMMTKAFPSSAFSTRELKGNGAKSMNPLYDVSFSTTSTTSLGTMENPVMKMDQFRGATGPLFSKPEPSAFDVEAYASHRSKIQPLLSCDPMRVLTKSEKTVIWQCRRMLLHEPLALKLLVRATDWENRHAVAELQRLMRWWTKPTPLEALQLLNATVGDPKVLCSGRLRT